MLLVVVVVVVVVVAVAAAVVVGLVIILVLVGLYSTRPIFQKRTRLCFGLQRWLKWKIATICR